MKIARSIQSVLFATLAFGCGSKTNASLCDQAVGNTNPACSQMCDPSPGAAQTCPTGFHCAPDGKCDAECDATHPCASGFTCDLSDGTCHLDDQGSGSGGPDANCPNVHFTAMPTTPSIQILIDRSGSMTEAFGNTTKYASVRDALVGTNGVVTQLQAHVYFGAALFSSDAVCPSVVGVSRALNNQTAIGTLIDSQTPSGNTPTAGSVDKSVADFVANPPPAGSPPILVLATDGQPNSCSSNTDTTAAVVTSIKAAYNTALGANPHLLVYVLGVGDAGGISNTSLQAFANAGVGVMPGQPDAPFYRGDSPAALAAAFQAIIGGVVSCDLMLSGQVDPAGALTSGQVTLNGMNLTPGTDWTVGADGVTLHLLGAACTAFKGSTNPMLDASFACGTVIM